MVAISKIEQVVWLDSYFDGKKLTPQESWKIAKKLYVPWILYMVWTRTNIQKQKIILQVMKISIPSLQANHFATAIEPQSREIFPSNSGNFAQHHL
jgi:hypothetical protein